MSQGYIMNNITRHFLSFQLPVDMTQLPHSNDTGLHDETCSTVETFYHIFMFVWNDTHHKFPFIGRINKVTKSKPFTKRHTQQTLLLLEDSQGSLKQNSHVAVGAESLAAGNPSCRHDELDWKGDSRHLLDTCQLCQQDNSEHMHNFYKY